MTRWNDRTDWAAPHGIPRPTRQYVVAPRSNVGQPRRRNPRITRVLPYDWQLEDDLEPVDGWLRTELG